MTAHRILQINALATATCAIGMLATRGVLYPLFGLSSPLLPDIVAIGLLVYAAALAAAAGRPPVSRRTLMAFTLGDALWVAVSVAVLVLFWPHLAPIARVLIVVVALAVELFATLQLKAAGAIARRSATAA